MADVFISYSQQVPEPTVALADELTKRGFKPWYDVNLLPHQFFETVITENVKRAKAVVTIWSRPALTSTWVPMESAMALGQNKLICVRAPDVKPDELPDMFKRMQVPVWSGQTGEDTINAVFQSLVTLGVTPAVGLDQTDMEKLTRAAQRDWRLMPEGDREALEAFLEEYTTLAMYRRMAQKRLDKLGTASPAVPAALELAPLTERANADTPEAATLRLDPAMHTAMIRRISLSTDGTRLASASDDKTVKLWALPEGRLIRTLRPPIGEGNEGKVYAVAVDPAGRWVAAGGWMNTGGGGHHITIFDTETGAVRARLGPIPNVVTDLEVNPDGARLAAGLYGQNGIRIWETANWQPIWQDKDYGGSVYGLAFAPDGRLATACEDGHVRLYCGDGQLLAKALSPGGGDPHSIAFSPDGTRLAVGYYDSLAVDVLDAASLQRLYPADTSGLSGGDLSKVAWLSGAGAGLRLAAGGRGGGRSERLFTWDEAGRGARRAWPSPANTIYDLAATPDGGPGSASGAGLVLAGGEPSLALYSADGTRHLNKRPEIADLRGKRYEHFTASADGMRLRFGLEEWSDAPALFDLAALSLTDAPEALPGLTQPDTDSLTITGWVNTREPALTRKTGQGAEDTTMPLELRPYEMARSLAIVPGGESFILGTEWWLRCFDATGSEIWRRAVPGTVWGVNLAREGRLILAAYADGTIRWHRASDGAELLALFIHLPDGPKDTAPENRDWILWTPEGY
ncbi:MAG: TIR domain-containing protein, partial [Pseudomonadota bacterium]